VSYRGLIKIICFSICGPNSILGRILSIGNNEYAAYCVTVAI
jgi:hypothetical protein